MDEPRDQSLEPCSPSAPHVVSAWARSDPSCRLNHPHIYKQESVSPACSQAVVVQGPSRGSSVSGPRPHLLYMFQKSCRLAWFTTFPICCR